ncbi:DUF4395 family protein [Salsipaludibacter albus]|uniref:DUF4395 family protein n=1 Tax=Salsipaludibacter albus TaxID=2849650 RepID=UPI001EE3F3E1|nr:DUF4395 domain-containing protein [Salsipaludibacter albus]
MHASTVPTTAPPAERPGEGRLDVRGQRFSAAVTTVVLAVALVVQGPVGIVLLALQVAVFALAVTRGVARSPWAVLFRVVRGRFALGPPTATEDARPARFAQACGLVVAGAGLAAVLAGATGVGWGLATVVLALAAVLAVTGLCVGCEVYVAALRLRGTR